ncbi:MAG: hypothetical protein IPL08_12165 [Saprospiraceae bacterium]|nr:hypothetical protein [Saprospiraceae bacterium]
MNSISATFTNTAGFTACPRNATLGQPTVGSSGWMFLAKTQSLSISRYAVVF